MRDGDDPDGVRDLPVDDNEREAAERELAVPGVMAWPLTRSFLDPPYGMVNRCLEAPRGIRTPIAVPVERREEVRDRSGMEQDFT